MSDIWTDPSWFYWWSFSTPSESDGIEWVPMVERPWHIDERTPRHFGALVSRHHYHATGVQRAGQRG